MQYGALPGSEQAKQSTPGSLVAEPSSTGPIPARGTMTMTPTQLTLRHLRANGWPLVAVVEHWNPHARIRQDLFGFGDVIALRRDETLLVQATSAPNVSSRVNKIADHPNVGHVREAGWRIFVYGWTKRKGRWVLAREVDVS